MLSKIRFIFPLIIMMLTLVSCGEKETTGPQEPQVKRTLLVYMVADNSLGSMGYDSDDMDEMLLSAGRDGLNGCRVIVYHHGRLKAPELLELTPQGFQILKTYPYDTTEYSVDATRMEQVILDSRVFAPANDYGLVLWSHGNGWIEYSGGRTEIKRSFGEDRGRHMNVTTLAEVLRGKGFSYVYFDCCHMATIEVAYELREVTPVIVASVTELPAAGMPYDQNLPVFLSDSPDLAIAANNTFNLYDSKVGSDRTCTITAIRTDRLNNLAEATRKVLENSIYTPGSEGLQRYMLAPCTLFDFGQYIDQCDCPDNLKEDWHTALDATIMYKNATPSIWNRIPINHYSGLGCYVFSSTADKNFLEHGYANFAWWEDVVSHNPLLSQSE